MFTIGETFVNTQFTTVPHQKLVCDFRRASARGFLASVWAKVIGRSNQLLDVKSIVQKKSIRNCRYIGAQTVDIKKIKGSEGRSADFDQNFNPLKTHNQNRWISIARAWVQGTYLPAVGLIKVGDVYIVRDGHHRISVARFMGSDYIDAQVMEWVL